MGKLTGFSSSSSNCSEAATGLVNSTPNCSESFFNFSSKRIFFSLLLCSYTSDLLFLQKMMDQNFPVLFSAFLFPPNKNILSCKGVHSEKNTFFRSELKRMIYKHESQRNLNSQIQGRSQIIL